jgi:DNA-binding MarR family transcriptional regulator
MERAEEILSAWLRLSNNVCNDRFVKHLTYNESLVCNIIYNQLKKYPDKFLTATDLCKQTRLIKSQMNRTINELEKKGLIVREQSLTDKRKLYVKFQESTLPEYEKSHNEILKIVDAIMEEVNKKFGRDITSEMIDIFYAISSSAKKILRENETV